MKMPQKLIKRLKTAGWSEHSLMRLSDLEDKPSVLRRLVRQLGKVGTRQERSNF